jgi:DNA-binding transcriptional ArsR family regulator
MKDGPSIVGIAALIGDHARAEVLTALMADRALTATELAGIAGVTKQTISAHLAKLVDAGLVAVDSQGRHRYFRLADRDVAHLLESLMGVAFRTGAVRARSSPREPALRRARVCYDHLAGEVGVRIYERLSERGALLPRGEISSSRPPASDCSAPSGSMPKRSPRRNARSAVRVSTGASAAIIWPERWVPRSLPASSSSSGRSARGIRAS